MLVGAGSGVVFPFADSGKLEGTVAETGDCVGYDGPLRLMGGGGSIERGGGMT